jgi:hypothetical protein
MGNNCPPNKYNGVNLSCNFGPGFLTNSDYCNDFYPGTSKESEKETQAIVNLIKDP